MKQLILEKKNIYSGVMLALLLMFIILILPVLYCFFFDYANGDDLWEGAVAHQVLVNNGTAREFFSEIYKWAKIDYNVWEGNWSSIILWCLEPSIWGEKAYLITPWLALFTLCGGTIYFLWYYLKKYFGGSRLYIGIISVLMCLFVIQYMPNIKNGLFWYTGMINYIFPYGWSLASFVWMDRFIDTGRKKYFIFLILFYAYLGGAGYIPIVFAFEILICVILANLLSHERVKMRRAVCLMLPFVLLTIGFIISAVSPGNAARGGDSYYFDVLRIFTTIGESMKQGLLGGIRNFLTIRPLILSLPLLAMTTWELVDISKVKLKLKYPVFILIFAYLVSCSVYAPGIYAQSEVSGGVPDVIYFVFLSAYFFAVIYLVCYFKKRYTEKGWKAPKKSIMDKLRLFIILGEVLLCLLLGRYMVGNMAGYMCLNFIREGHLHDFESQMQERLLLLQDPKIKNVILPEMNNEQGPFMHMALLDNPGAYTNQATMRFYGKESVIAIPRTEYYEKYGYPEDRKKE